MSEIPVVEVAPPASLKAQRQVFFPQPDGSNVPYRVFSAQEVYDREQERIFRGPVWSFLGLEAEIPNVGDFKSTFIGDTPVVVTRTPEGLSCWVNRCAHRGAMVCREKRGNAASHTCVYHQWSFAANGDLQGVPFRRGQKGMVGMPKDFKPEEHNLHKLRVDSYKGLLFATFSGETPPLPDYLGAEMRPWIDRIFHKPIVYLGCTRQYSKSNWKLYFENVKDPYHASLLHLFHTTFNVLGVVLMWPLADGLTRWLLQRFRAREEDEAQPRYLDDNVLAVPALALDALEREVARFGQLCVRIAGAVLTGAAPVALVGDRSAMTQLDAAVESFAERLSRLALSKVASERLAELLRIHRYYKTCADQAQTAAPLQAPVDPALATHQQTFVAALQQLFTQQDTESVANGDAPVVDVVPMELAYQNLKAAVLVSAAAGALPLSQMETALGQYSALRRAAQQAAKAREHLHHHHAA